MIRKLIIYIGRTKNPSFRLSEDASSWWLFSFLFSQTLCIVRGMRIFIYFKNPRMLLLGRRVNISGHTNIRFGKFVRVGDNTVLSGFGGRGLSIGNHSWIGSNSIIKVSFSFNDPGEHISIGNHVGLGDFAHLVGGGGLSIGDYCIIGPYLRCHPENHLFERNNLLIRNQGVTRKGIIIGKNCWIGAKVTILDGVTIGDNCVIAAGAVVTKSIVAGMIVAGVPAKNVRCRSEYVSNAMHVA